MLLLATDYIALIASSMSGTILGIEKKLDLFGIWLMALIASFGGGILRDVLLGRLPIFFLNYQWVLAVSIVSVVVICIARFWKGWWESRFRHYIAQVHNVFDAIGLAAFAISGVQVAIAMGYSNNVILCVCMGTVTGIGGGVMRDLMVVQLPGVFRKRVYAVAAIFGSLLYWFCLRMGMMEGLAWALSMVFIIAVRICATVFHWNVPGVPLPKEMQEARRSQEDKT